MADAYGSGPYGETRGGSTPLVSNQFGVSENYFFAGMYFQLRALPSASHLMDFARRSIRVSSRFASVIHWMYSRRWLGEKPSKVLRAFAFFLSAAVKSAGIGSGSRFFRSVRQVAFTPASLSAAAFFT